MEQQSDRAGTAMHTTAFDSYAVIWSPSADSALGRFGQAWTRSDNHAAPRGLPAIVKSPFRLATGATPAALGRAIGRAVAGHRAVTLPKLAVTVFQGRVVLAPETSSRAVTRLIGDVADAVLGLQAPTRHPREVAGHPDGTVPGRRDWGAIEMPILERFHIALTTERDLATAYALVERLQPRLAGMLAEPLRLGEITLVGVPAGRCAAWQVIGRYRLGRAPARAEGPAGVRALPTAA